MDVLVETHDEAEIESFAAEMIDRFGPMPDEVKQLMRGTILEIRMDDPRPAVAVLRERLPEATVGLFGDRVHVVCREPERTTSEAEAALAQAGLGVLGIRPIEPSLEDVFISVLAETAA